MKRSSLLVACVFILYLMIFIPPQAAAQIEQESSGALDVLYGENFPPEEVDLLTLTPNHNLTYGAFEHYGFIDLYYEPNENEITAHLEYYPKISLTRAGAFSMDEGLFADILLGGGINADFGGEGDGWVWLAGPVWKFNLPGFDSFQLETYYYQQEAPQGNDYDGTYQVTPSWTIYFPMSDELEFRFSGFIDFIGDRGPGTHQVISHPKFLVDIGTFWDNPRSVYAGTEWRYWYNKGGEDGITESVFQWGLVFEL